MITGELTPGSLLILVVLSIMIQSLDSLGLTLWTTCTPAELPSFIQTSVFSHKWSKLRLGDGGPEGVGGGKILLAIAADDDRHPVVEGTGGVREGTIRLTGTGPGQEWGPFGPSTFISRSTESSICSRLMPKNEREHSKPGRAE